MKLTGEQHIPQPQEVVWTALNDPDVLLATIPGCHEIEQLSEEAYRIVLAVAVGPVKAKFNGTLHLTNRIAPDSYSLTFEGTGGAVGFGKGTADVALQPVDDGTLLTYGVQAQVGGKIAQVGARLIDGVAAKMAAAFFAAFEQHLADQAGVKVDGADGPSAGDVESSAEAAVPVRSRWKFWEKQAP